MSTLDVAVRCSMCAARVGWAGKSLRHRWFLLTASLVNFNWFKFDLLLMRNWIVLALHYGGFYAQPNNKRQKGQCAIEVELIVQFNYKIIFSRIFSRGYIVYSLIHMVYYFFYRKYSKQHLLNPLYIMIQWYNIIQTGLLLHPAAIRTDTYHISSIYIIYYIINRNCFLAWYAFHFNLIY